jgi:hypothetical protein
MTELPPLAHHYNSSLSNNSFSATNSSFDSVTPLPIFSPSADQSRRSYLGSRSFQLMRLISFAHPTLRHGSGQPRTVGDRGHHRWDCPALPLHGVRLCGLACAARAVRTEVVYTAFKVSLKFSRIIASTGCSLLSALTTASPNCMKIERALFAYSVLCAWS